MNFSAVVQGHMLKFLSCPRSWSTLARALVHNPVVLLLDEATSALDAITESRVQEALASLNCTRIVIAHRLSTVDSDLILVMDEGQLVKADNHDHLRALGPATPRRLAPRKAAL